MKKLYHVPTALLRADLSHVLAAIEAGDEIEVTRYGRTIARITPAHKQPRPVLRLVVDNTNTKKK